jgi:hypothetical protein
MYRTIKRRLGVGNITLVTAINTVGTIISLFIILWIFSIVSEIKLETNPSNVPYYCSQELFRGISSHGFLSSLLSTIYLSSKQHEKLRHFYLFLTIGSLWLLFTTKSIWPSLLLGCCMGLFLPRMDSPLLDSIQYPDL